MAKVLHIDYETQTDGEKLTARSLSQLPDNWLIICNKVLVFGRDYTREVDFIVVGNNSIIAIDEKSWSGTISGTSTSWSQSNGDSQRSPLNKVEMVSKALAGHIREKTPYIREFVGNNPFVRGCVSLTNQTSQPVISDPRSPELVILHHELTDRLKRLDAQYGDPNIGKLRNHIETTLVDLRDRPKRPKNINEYSILDGYDGIGSSRVCRAIHSEGDERLLTVFNIGPDDQENRDFCLQEFRTLRRLAPLGITPSVYDYFRWSDDYIVVPSDVPNGTSIGSMGIPSSLADILIYLRRFKAIYEALSRIHSEGIIHRSIGPEHIYIHEDSHNIRVEFTGFYAARKPDMNDASFSIGPKLSSLNIEDPLSAPEISIMGYEYADFTSDTYSTSLMMLELMSDVSAEKMSESDNKIDATTQSIFWQLIHRDIREALKTFFEDTLGGDPPISNNAKGRLSATDCVARLSEIIQRMAN